MNLPELLEKFAKNEATPAETEAFSAWLATLGREEYAQLLDTYGEIVHAAAADAAPDKGLLAAIQQRIALHEPANEYTHLSPESSSVIKIPVKNRRWLYYGAAAAILIAALTTTRFFFRKAPAVTVAAAKPIAIPPGGNKAILTLANGQQVVLDDAQQGAVATQGAVKIIKINKTVLAYKAGAAESGKTEYNTISTPRGGQYELVLPDGTHAWLNAASSLRFSVAFSGAERKVELKGEGYFAVAADEAHPFVVAFGHAQVQVLGTEFNIKAYDDEPVTQSTLVSGRIRLLRGEEAVLLQPGKMAVIGSESGGSGVRGSVKPIQMVTADVEQVTAWKNGKMSFANIDFATFMREVSRWYDVDVRYTGPVPEKRFFGLINRNVYLSTILDFLHQNGVHVKQEGRTITILP